MNEVLRWSIEAIVQNWLWLVGVFGFFTAGILGGCIVGWLENRSTSKRC